MEQLSTDWYEWRSKGIGSSDVAAILGLSPYLTPLQLYRIKTGIDAQAVDNPATYRGRKFEPKARACFELTNSKDYQPRTFQSLEYPFMRVSLDGWHDEDREILEIKCPGKETLKLASEGQVPEHYFAQIQYQLFVANGSKAIYFAFDPDSEKGFQFPVLPNTAFLKMMVPEVAKFWMRVQRKDPPPLSERDWCEFPSDLKPLIELWKVQHVSGMAYDALQTRKILIEKMSHPKMRGFGLKVYPSRSTGGKEGVRFQLEKEEETEISPSSPH